MSGRKRGLKFLSAIAMAMMLLLVVKLADAHAILKESWPVPNSTVTGPDVPLKLQFNVRIDAGRSKLQLVNPDNSIVDLIVEKQNAPDTLAANMTGLKTGDYKIRWQVLAPDGHITRGEIPFKVGS